MSELQTFWNELTVYMQSGFQEINALQGLLIAIGAAFFMYRWGSVFAVAVGATVVHLVVDVMLPVLANQETFRLPPVVESSFWQQVLTIYIGYVVVITVFYVIKSVLLTNRHELA